MNVKSRLTSLTSKASSTTTPTTTTKTMTMQTTTMKTLTTKTRQQQIGQQQKRQRQQHQRQQQIWYSSLSIIRNNCSSRRLLLCLQSPGFNKCSLPLFSQFEQLLTLRVVVGFIVENHNPQHLCILFVCKSFVIISHSTNILKIFSASWTFCTHVDKRK